MSVASDYGKRMCGECMWQVSVWRVGVASGCVASVGEAGRGVTARRY